MVVTRIPSGVWRQLVHHENRPDGIGYRPGALACRQWVIGGRSRIRIRNVRVVATKIDAGAPSVLVKNLDHVVHPKPPEWRGLGGINARICQCDPWRVLHIQNFARSGGPSPIEPTINPASRDRAFKLLGEIRFDPDFHVEHRRRAGDRRDLDQDFIDSRSQSEATDQLPTQKPLLHDVRNGVAAVVVGKGSFLEHAHDLKGDRIDLTVGIFPRETAGTCPRKNRPLDRRTLAVIALEIPRNPHAHLVV